MNGTELSGMMKTEENIMELMRESSILSAGNVIKNRL